MNKSVNEEELIRLHFTWTPLANKGLNGSLKFQKYAKFQLPH